MYFGHMTLGQRIRHIRTRQNLTLKDVASITNLTESLISQIETGKANPSIGSLIAISKALNVGIVSFFDDQKKKIPNPVIRQNERSVVHTKSGITYYLLVPEGDEIPLEVLYVEYEKGSSTEVLNTHEGFECGFILEGKLEVQIGESRYILNRGDTITYKSTDAHLITNRSQGKTIAIWINSPASF